VVTATKAQDTNFFSATSANTTITVNKAAQTNFTVTSAASFTTGSTLQLTASGGQSTGSVTWSLTSGNCTLSGTSLTGSRGGITCVVEATKAGDSNYLASSDSKTVTVSKVAQLLTFRSTAPSPATVGSTYTVSVESDAFLAPTVAIANSSSSVCSVSAGVVTFNSVGTCIVSASQAGNDTYASAAASQSITVTAVAASAPNTVPPSVTVPVSQTEVGAPATTTTTLPLQSATTLPQRRTDITTTTSTSTTTTTTVPPSPGDPSSPNPDTDGGLPELGAGETMAMVRGEKVALKVSRTDGIIKVNLPNNVQLTLGTDNTSGDTVMVGPDGVLRMSRRDFVDVNVDNLVPGTTYTVYMFSTPIELARGVADSQGRVNIRVGIPDEADDGSHTMQVNGVGEGAEVVSISLGFEVISKQDNTALTVSVLIGAMLLALLGGRPVFRRRRLSS